ncbi:corticotropin-releasing factor receptor 1-like [Varroa destructor]|uniref:Uncharacterized protein n=1 Tax=Varroa destructor TaxID=109461 RepID=A0A7M7IYR0_VARDE|nr:corticotropin-releasing factor receptor 1-like [Varroa destructor]
MRRTGGSSLMGPLANSTTTSTSLPIQTLTSMLNAGDTGGVLLDEFFANFTESECAGASIAANFTKGDVLLRCPSSWDGISCWPSVAAGLTVSRSCKLLFETMDDAQHSLYAQYGAGPRAYRRCSYSGHWADNITNYNACIAVINMVKIPESSEHADLLPLTVTGIVVCLSSISLLFLTASAFIFAHFSGLECSRTRVHQQFVVALILNALSLLAISVPVTLHNLQPDIPNITKETPLLCKLVLCVKMYSSNASINWMFVEGLLLHSRVTTQIFKQDAPFRLYYAIGWGLPLATLLPWAGAMQAELPSVGCWEGYARSPAVWLLIAPRLAALSINMVFLTNIIRVVVSRTQRNSDENKQFKKAVRATLLLFPLLGVPHLLFAINPHEMDARLQNAYFVINAVLQSSQGIFVAVIYCFMNVEVQTCIRNAYLRAAIRRNPNRRSLVSHRFSRGINISQRNRLPLQCRRRNQGMNGGKPVIVVMQKAINKKIASKECDVSATYVDVISLSSHQKTSANATTVSATVALRQFSSNSSKDCRTVIREVENSGSGHVVLNDGSDLTSRRSAQDYVVVAEVDNNRQRHQSALQIV